LGPRFAVPRQRKYLKKKVRKEEDRKEGVGGEERVKRQSRRGSGGKSGRRKERGKRLEKMASWADEGV